MDKKTVIIIALSLVIIVGIILYYKNRNTVNIRIGAMNGGASELGKVSKRNVGTLPIADIKKAMQEAGYNTDGWLELGLRDWAYAIIRKVKYFNHNGLYYTTAKGEYVGEFDALPKGAIYTKKINGKRFRKNV